MSPGIAIALVASNHKRVGRKLNPSYEIRKVRFFLSQCREESWADLAAPAAHPNPPGSRQVFGLAPVAAVSHHAPHRPTVGALCGSGTGFMSLIFDVCLDFRPKGDYNDHSSLEWALADGLSRLEVASAPPFCRLRPKLSLFACFRKRKSRSFWSGSQPGNVLLLSLIHI